MRDPLESVSPLPAASRPLRDPLEGLPQTPAAPRQLRDPLESVAPIQQVSTTKDAPRPELNEQRAGEQPEYMKRAVADPKFQDREQRMGVVDYYQRQAQGEEKRIGDYVGTVAQSDTALDQTTQALESVRRGLITQPATSIARTAGDLTGIKQFREAGDAVDREMQLEYGVDPESDINTAANVTGAVVGSLPFGAAGRAGIAGMAALGGVQGYDRARQEGAEAGSPGALATGAVSAALDAVQFPITRAVANRVTPTNATLGQQYAANVAGSAVEQVTINTAQQAAENQIAAGSYDPGRPLDYGIRENLVGSVPGALIYGGYGTAAARAAGRQRTVSRQAGPGAQAVPISQMQSTPIERAAIKQMARSTGRQAYGFRAPDGDAPGAFYDGNNIFLNVDEPGRAAVSMAVHEALAHIGGGNVKADVNPNSERLRAEIDVLRATRPGDIQASSQLYLARLKATAGQNPAMHAQIARLEADPVRLEEEGIAYLFEEAIYLNPDAAQQLAATAPNTVTRMLQAATDMVPVFGKRSRLQRQAEQQMSAFEVLRPMLDQAAASNRLRLGVEMNQNQADYSQAAVEGAGTSVKGVGRAIGGPGRGDGLLRYGRPGEGIGGETVTTPALDLGGPFAARRPGGELRDKTYMDVGHDNDDSEVWALDKSGVVTSERVTVGGVHADYGLGAKNTFRAFGRVDHKRKQISVWSDEIGRNADKVNALLQKNLIGDDLADYEIRRFGRHASEGGPLAALRTQRGEAELKKIRQRAANNPGGLFTGMLLDPDFSRSSERSEEKFFTRVSDWMVRNWRGDLNNLEGMAEHAVTDIKNVFGPDEAKRYSEYYDQERVRERRALIDARFPELKSGKKWKLYNAFWAIGSNGTRLTDNMAEVIDVWSHYRSGGDFKPGKFKKGQDPVVFRGPYPGTKKQHYSVLKRLIDVDGEDGLLRFLEGSHTASELSKIRKALGWSGGIETKRVKAIVRAATGQDEQIPGSFIFGPKLGAYMQNAFGRPEFQTADLWEGLFYRMFTAADGLEFEAERTKKGKTKTSVVKHPRDADDNERMARFGDIIQRAMQMPTPAASQAQRWFAIKKALGLLGYTKAGSLETSNEATQRILERSSGEAPELAPAAVDERSGRVGEGSGVRRGRSGGDAVGPNALRRGEALVNIGLDIPGGGRLTPDEARTALQRFGVRIASDAVHQSDTEQTLVARLDRALTPEEADQLSRVLKQEAVAQFSDGAGELYGPKADAWRPFNPEYFLTESGQRASDSPLAAKRAELLSEPSVDPKEREKFIRGFANISTQHAMMNARYETLERRGELAPASADILRGIFALSSSPPDFTPLKITARLAAAQGGPFQLWVDYRNRTTARENFGATNAEDGINISMSQRYAARTPENLGSQRTPNADESGGNDVAVMLHELGHGIMDIARSSPGAEIFPSMKGRDLVEAVEANWNELLVPPAKRGKPQPQTTLPSGDKVDLQPSIREPGTGNTIHDYNAPAMRFMREASAGADESRNVRHWAKNPEEWFAQTFANWVIANKVPDPVTLPAKSPLRKVLDGVGRHILSLVKAIKKAFGVQKDAAKLTLRDLEAALESAFQGPTDPFRPITNAERVKRIQRGHEVLQGKYDDTVSPLALFREDNNYLTVGHGEVFGGGSNAELWAFQDGGLKKVKAEMQSSVNDNTKQMFAETHSDVFPTLKIGSPTGRIDHDKKVISVASEPFLRPSAELQYKMAVRQLAREHPGYKIKVFGEGPGRVRDASDGQFALRRRGPDTVGSRFTLGGETVEDLIRRKVQDDFLPVQRMQQDVKGQGGKLSEASDANMRQTLFKGRVATQFDRLEDEVIKPIVNRMVRAKLTVPEVDEYLIAIHAPERNRQIAKINKLMPDSGSGMSNADAAAAIARWNADPRISDLREIAKTVHKMNRQILRQLVSNGLLHRDTAKAMLKAYKFYVPLRTESDEQASTGQGYTARSAGVQRATGRGAGNIAASPLQFSVLQAREKIVRAEKNRVARAVAKFVKSNPDNGLWSIDTTPLKPVVNPHTGMVDYRLDRRFKFADNVVPFMARGKMHLIEFKGEHGLRLANAFKRVNYEDGGVAVQWLGKAMRGYASLQTNLNPAFIVPNFVRDLATAGIRVSAERSGDEAARVVRNVFKSMRAVWDVAKDRNAGKGSEYHDYFREYREHGGKIDSYAIGDFVKIGKDIQRLLDNANAKGARRGLVAMKQAKDFIDRMNGAVETATRLSAYVEARKGGMSADRASVWAKELTVNFNRKGEWGTAINSLWLFANASLQGNVNMLRTVMRHKRGRQIGGGIMLAGLAAGVALPLLFGQDEEGRDVWDTIPDSIKETNLLFPIGGGKYGKIPLPYGYNALYNVGRLAAETVTGQTKPTSAGARLMINAVDTFSPLGHEGSLLQTISPTFVDPLVQISENKAWTGLPIVPEQSPFGPQKPDSTLARRDTSSFAKGVARLLNDVTGGDAVTSGSLDVSPATIEHWLGFATGGLGRFLGETATLPTRIAEGEVPANKIPLVDRFVGEPPRGRNMRDFYELLDKGQDSASDIRHYIEQGESSKANERIEDDRRDLAFAAWARDIERRMQGMDEPTQDLKDEISELLEAKNGGGTPPRKWADAATLSILEGRQRRASALLREISNGGGARQRDEHRRVRLTAREQTLLEDLRRRSRQGRARPDGSALR